MRLARTRRWLRPHRVRFESVTESPAQIWARRGSLERPGQPYGGAVVCARTGSVRSLDDCVHCGHFVDVRARPAQHDATLRCLHDDDDPVPRDIMDWPSVPADLAAATARRILWLQRLPFLLVVEGSLIVGQVLLASLALDAAGAVSQHMVESPWSLTPAATLGDAVEALRELHLPALLVVDAELELRSVVSPALLRRCGVPVEALGL